MAEECKERQKEKLFEIWIADLCTTAVVGTEVKCGEEECLPSSSDGTDDIVIGTMTVHHPGGYH